MSVRRRKVRERLARQDCRAGVVRRLREFGLGLERATAVARAAQREGITKMTPELAARILQAIDAQAQPAESK